MTPLSNVLNLFLWPGDRFCEMVGAPPAEDSGLLRGFINSIVWGLVAVIVLWRVM